MVSIVPQGGPRHTEAEKNANIKARRMAVEAKRDSGQFVASYTSPLPAWSQYHRWQEKQGQTPAPGAYTPGPVGTYYQGNQQFSPQGAPITPGMFNPPPPPGGDVQPTYRQMPPGGQAPPPAQEAGNPWENWLANHYSGGSYGQQVAGTQAPPAQPDSASREALTQAMMRNWG